MVHQIEGRYGQNGKTATIEVGIAVGIAASACVLLLLYITLSYACKARRQFPPQRPPLEAEDTDLENADRNTEGAYRSGSDTDEEEERDQIAKEARCANGVRVHGS